MTELILHHYPQSPVTEKVRIALGIKNLDWRSVEIPRLPPRPDLEPMTGGYRRTPVLQIGADIYCDSQCILRELDRRCPSPGLLAGEYGELAWGFSRWIDGPVFTSAIAVVLGSAESLPEDFAADRGRLYFGEDFRIENLQRQVAHHITQLNGQFAWVEQALGSRDGGASAFFSGDKPGLLDAMVYYIAWFLKGRWSGGNEFLSRFPLVSAWQQRMESIGHGRSTDLDSKQALQIAIESEPQTGADQSVTDPSGITPGTRVAIEPDVGGGDPLVTGEVVLIDANRIAIARQDAVAGNAIVHFPRVGYRVTITG